VLVINGDSFSPALVGGTNASFVLTKVLGTTVTYDIVYRIK